MTSRVIYRALVLEVERRCFAGSLSVAKIVGCPVPNWKTVHISTRIDWHSLRHLCASPRQATIFCDWILGKRRVHVWAQRSQRRKAPIGRTTTPELSLQHSSAQAISNYRMYGR